MMSIHKTPGSRTSLRVLHVVSGDLWAGAEVQVYQVLRAACRQPGIDLHAVVLNPGMLSDRLATEGVAVTVLDESKHGFRMLARSVRALAQDWQPNVVHTHRRKEHLLGALVARTCGAGHVATVHGRNEFQHAWSDIRHTLLRVAERVVLARACDRLIAVSEDLALELPGAQHHKVVIPNSVDVAAVREAAMFEPAGAMDEDRVHIGFMGRLVPVKQVDHMLNMMQRLEASRPGQWALHLVGDGPLRSQLQRLAVELGLEQSVTFHGFLPNPLGLLAQMDLFLFASAHEGLPMTALEALSLGVPIVSPPIDSIERLIAEAGSGAVAKSAHPTHLADAVLAMQLQPRAERILRPALLPKRYRIDHGMTLTIALWQEVAGKRRRTR